MWQILGKEDKMKKFNLKKLTVTAILAAVAVVGSLFSFPVFGSKCAPVQHLVNILCAVTVGPWWALAQAFIAALIRNLLGLGSPLAFPGSMCLYWRSSWNRNHWWNALLSGGISCHG